MGNRRNSAVFIVMFLLLIGLSAGAMMYCGKPSPSEPGSANWAIVQFVFDLLSVAGLVGSIGFAVTGSLSGVAINGLNQFSLSRLQMAAWTIVVLGALLTFVKLYMFSYFGSDGNIEKLDIPHELLIAMGIAAFSTTAVPSILAIKAGQDGPSPDSPEGQAVAARFSATTGTPTDHVTMTGQCMGRTMRSEASWIDMVTGDETANAGAIDISKVQQLLVTLLLLGTVVGMVIHKLATTRDMTALGGLPPLSQEMIGLLAISHAGYLGYKVAPKATSSTDTAGDAAGGSAAVDGSGRSNDPVQMRLAITNANTASNLKVTLNGAPAVVDGNGFVELSLVRNKDNVVEIAAMRGGVPVQASFHVVPSDTDHDMTHDVALV